MPEKGSPEISGDIKYQGDIARIRQWFSDPAKPSTWQLAGKLSGAAQLRPAAAGAIHGELATDVSNLVVVDATGQQVQEPRIQLAAGGDYNRQTGAMQFTRCELSSDALAANVAGRVAPVSGKSSADINAQLRYDLERIAGLLRPYFGPNVQIKGQGTSAAWYRGPFALDTGSAAAGMRWDSANLYGFGLGPGELKIAMANGIVQVEPIDVAVGQGRIHAAPQLRLTSSPMEFLLPNGSLVQRVQVTPSMCASALKFIAPALADVTTASGTFSIDMDGCRVPVGEPAKSEIAGRLTIHSIETSSGPLTQSLSTFVGDNAPVRLRQDSVVAFRMVNGRIYHQGLEMLFPGFSIRTYGSVGLDQSLAIIAEMPIPPKWVANNPAAAKALGNQTIQVPINGTLSKPELDKKTLDDLSKQFLQKAAGNLLKEGVGNQLDRLFGPKK
jgi:hypothetical protein